MLRAIADRTDLENGKYGHTKTDSAYPKIYLQPSCRIHACSQWQIRSFLVWNSHHRQATHQTQERSVGPRKQRYYTAELTSDINFKRQTDNLQCGVATGGRHILHKSTGNTEEIEDSRGCIKDHPLYHGKGNNEHNDVLTQSFDLICIGYDATWLKKDRGPCSLWTDTQMGGSAHFER